jgi:hypothetical protein
MSENGLAGWLIPSEFMDVNYGKQIKSYLLNQVTLLRVHRFDPEAVQFDDALVSSTVVWFRNAPPNSDQPVTFTFGGTLADPAVSTLVLPETLSAVTKWTSITNTERASKRHPPQLSISDLFTIHRGVATGANEYFILDRAKVDEYVIPKAYLTPILPAPRYLPTDEVEANPDDKRPLRYQRFLLTCDIPQAEIQERHTT